MSEERWTDEREIRISAHPDSVWAAWAEPEHVRRWFADDAHGLLEDGGRLVHEFEGHPPHEYQVVRVDEPHRLVLEGEMQGRAFRQVVELRQEGGSTVLRLVHSGFGRSDPDSEIVQGIDSGWTMALALLKHYVEAHFGREKTTISVLRPAAFEYERLLHHHYLDAGGLGGWLTDGSSGIRDQGEVALRLRGGRALTGSVLARTDHEVSLTWDEVEGVLELKAFGSGPEARMLGARLVSWSEDDPLLAALAGELRSAVERLLRQVDAR